MRTFDIPKEARHPGWTGEAKDAPPRPGINFNNQDLVHQWMVKFEFDAGPMQFSGSGFFVNIPDATHDVILTAGHNFLYEGTRTTNMKIYYLQPDPNKPDGPPVVVSHDVQESDIYINPDFLKARDSRDDWAALRLPRGTVMNHGFGFSMRLVHEDKAILRSLGYVTMNGFRTTTPPGYPITSTGAVVERYEKVLEYRVETEPGISGSVAWIGYQGNPTAVAIHNYGAKGSKASRGSLITPALLRSIFEWVGVGRYGKQLRAQKQRAAPGEDDLKLPAAGLFLDFPSVWPMARVKLGSSTAFDVLPGETISGVQMSPSDQTWVMGTTVGGKQKWVTFDALKDHGEVNLGDKVKEGCLFNQRNKKETKKIMRLVVETNDGKYQLKMTGEYIDEDETDAESSEVSMVRYPGKSNEQFTTFWFE